MDKWAKLYKQIESEYNACRKVEKELRSAGKTESADYMRDTWMHYQDIMVLMYSIEREGEDVCTSE